jgi:hypothetical protein
MFYHFYSIIIIILRRERFCVAHYVIFSSFIFFITIIALGLSTGDRPQRVNPRWARARPPKAVTSYFLSYIFFFLLQPMWILIPYHRCLLNYLWLRETSLNRKSVVCLRIDLPYYIILCCTILFHTTNCTNFSIK